MIRMPQANLDQFSAIQAYASLKGAQFVLQLGRLWLLPGLTPQAWLQFLQAIFPEVQKLRREASLHARAFFDVEKRHHFPESDRFDQHLLNYDFRDFVRDMEPSRKNFSRERAPESALVEVAGRVVRNIENGGRRQLIQMVYNENTEPVDEPVRVFTDETPVEIVRRELEGRRSPAGFDRFRSRGRTVKGWARVATGAETCDFCLTMISRGPVYFSSETAGFTGHDDAMLDAFDDLPFEEYLDFTGEHIEEWHDNCDCRVVPVFDTRDWPGRDQYLIAQEMWVEASREARGLEERRHTRGKKRGKWFTHSEETMLLLRRKLYAGEIDMRDIAVTAANPLGARSAA